MRMPFKVPASISFLLAMTLLLGFAYPALVTGIAQLAFPKEANGSLLVVDGAVRGSRLLAQDFSSPAFFRARPSATAYTYIGAGGSNLGPTSAALAKAVADRRAAWESSFGPAAPADMLYASGSGLDPDISLEAALAQVSSVAKARALDAKAEAELEKVVRDEAARSASPIAAPRVNVVELNAIAATDPRFAGRGR